jgi:crossover junction endodeoxyribonuclease RusA
MDRRIEKNPGGRISTGASTGRAKSEGHSPTPPDPFKQVVVELPPPPSSNNLFLSRGRRRVRTPRYRAWQEAAGWQLLVQRPGRITGPWQADITLPSGVRGDIDNRVKAILDLLVAHRIVADDKFCQRVSIEKTDETESVLITVRAAK